MISPMPPNSGTLSDLVSQPRIVGFLFDDRFPPPIPTMSLDWSTDAVLATRSQWQMPGNVTLASSAPRRFGIQVCRRESDQYSIYLVWDDTKLAWDKLTARELMECCLGCVLEAMGTDLQELLDQPIEPVSN